jgi:hypothetical protein
VKEKLRVGLFYISGAILYEVVDIVRDDNFRCKIHLYNHTIKRNVHGSLLDGEMQELFDVASPVVVQLHLES